MRIDKLLPNEEIIIPYSFLQKIKIRVGDSTIDLEGFFKILFTQTMEENNERKGI